MRLISGHIKNFKAIKEINIVFNKELNVFTGSNNSGKTTILEGISLWTEIFYKLYSKALKNDAKRNIKSGYYKLGNKTNYFDYIDFKSIRMVGYSEIFHNLDENSTIELSFKLENDRGEELEISFSLKKSAGKSLNVYLTNYDDFIHSNLNTFFNSTVNPISINYSNPLNHLPEYEEKKVDSVVKYLIESQKSEEALKNRLSRILSTPEKFENLKNDLKEILGVEKLEIQIDDLGREYSVKLALGNQQLKDISLYGSGTLQLIQFLINIYESNNSDFQIVLFDEPDSHIHRDIQKKLISTLMRDNKFQLFMTTHNESFIRNSSEKNLFHITNLNTSHELKPIGDMMGTSVREGIIASQKNLILKELSGEEITGLHFIEALEADRIFFVEGSMDAEFLLNVFDTGLGTNKKKDIFWVFNGIDGIFKHLHHYKTVFTAVKNGKSLWEKTYMMIDRDFFTNNLKEKFEKQFKEIEKIKTYITNSYCMDSIYLKDIENFSKILEKSFLDEKTFEEILRVLNEKIENKVKEKKEEWECLGQAKFKESINKVKNSDYYSSLSGFSGFNDYSSATYQNEILAKEEFYKFLNKDDFYEILEATFKIFDIEFEESGFLRIIFKTIADNKELRPNEYRLILETFN